ncbi:PREDICTED: F-box protein At5g65850-like isoform X2 [Nicotiana attenuata]|uniref:F-box protein At5g65850-like isoform X2 n=1 Tax=Nicotiana attenuata TaxID=49451 RepID=UPI000904B829|nr:PREDICTED: F-box protein At5g65850-like isoform X2 [Nicotiana attenuata]
MRHSITVRFSRTPRRPMKKKMNSTGRKLSIPQEIMYEIFSWLPVKSLVRFKCVTKFCNSLATESDFLNIHVRRSMTRPGGTEFFSHETRPVFYTTGQIEDGRASASLLQIDDFYYHAPAYSGLDYVNGLFCFWGPTFAGPAAIFNPSKGESHKEINQQQKLATRSQ